MNDLITITVTKKGVEFYIWRLNRTLKIIVISWPLIISNNRKNYSIFTTLMKLVLLLMETSTCSNLSSNLVQVVSDRFEHLHSIFSSSCFVLVFSSSFCFFVFNMYLSLCSWPGRVHMWVIFQFDAWSSSSRTDAQNFEGFFSNMFTVLSLFTFGIHKSLQ